VQKSSNAYILGFVIAMAVLSATLLAFVSESLRPKQNANIALEKKKFILTTYMGNDKVSELSDEEINTKYDDNVVARVVNFGGEVLEGITDKEIVAAVEYKKSPENRSLPIYEIYNESKQLEYVVLPLYGFGLWDNIWGYVALENDLSTIKGVVFDHKGETPGLGARITEQQIKDRYVGKKILDEQGRLVSVVMQKGEKGGGARSIEAFASNPHSVDGMSGATITANGLNNMFKDYLNNYQNYLATLNN
jgi:Na+-transporting NADH:ubiquinone oxidoreductase subunit C